MPDPKPFRCDECDWILGESYRLPGKRITQLRIFRHAQSSDFVEDKNALPVPTAIRFAANQVNDCMVLCEHCGSVTSWYANQTAIQDILSRRQKMKQEVARESVP